MAQREKETHRYCVLYTQVMQQERLRSVLKAALPEERGTVFYPCMEAYHRDAGGTIQIQPMFPGYVFVRSDMKAAELHEFIKAHTRELQSHIREVGISQRRAGGEDPYAEETDIPVSDVSPEEAQFLDFLLDADQSGGEPGQELEQLRQETKIGSNEGLLKMSYGYKEYHEGKPRYRVMEGPLRAYEDHIEKVSAHDRRAYLDLNFGGRVVRAGFEVLPKKHWFPEDDGAPEVLGDGSEVDLDALIRSMTRIR